MSCKISKGEKFSEINISIKRLSNSNNSVSPIFYKKLIGKSSLKNYEVTNQLFLKS